LPKNKTLLGRRTRRRATISTQETACQTMQVSKRTAKSWHARLVLFNNMVTTPTLMDLDPQQSKSAAQVSSGSLLTPAAASMQATDDPSTSAVPATVADPALAAGPQPADTPMLPAVPLLVPLDLPCAYGQRMLTYLLTLPRKQSSMCMPTLHQSSASIPQQIALACPSRCRSSWSQQSEQSLVMHRSTCCVAQTHSQTAQEHGHGQLRSHPASDSLVADSPSMPTTSATAAMAAPRRSGRQHTPAAEYWKVAPAAPGGAQ